MHKGDIYFADLSPVVGSEQGGMRPVLIIQNDIGNTHSATTIVAPLTTRDKTPLPTHVPVKLNDVDNVVLLEQIRAISVNRVISYYGTLSMEDMWEVDKAIRISLGIDAASDPAPIPRQFIPSNRPRRKQGPAR